jgi:fructokinase
MVVVCGEALIDLVPAGPTDGPPTGDTWHAVPGGGAANTAVALARLGTATRLLCRLSGDAFGRQIRRHLLANGVDLGLAARAREASTLAVVGLDDSGAAEYQFYVDNTADWQWTPEELPAALPPGTRALHFGTLASILPPGADVLRAWADDLRATTTIVYDVNVRPALLPDRAEYSERIAAWLDVAHVVKASDDDLAWLHPGRSPLDTARAWLADHDLDLVLLTRGADGAVAVVRGGPPIEAPGLPVRVADTVGAGDTFTAAFLHTILDETTPGCLSGVPAAALAEALRYAVAASALACTREGAVPPTLAELSDFLAAPA